MMEDGFEATFVVQAPSREVWKALSPDGAVPWAGPAGYRGSRRREPPSRSTPSGSVRKDTAPCEGTEIVVTLEDVESGTKVTVVQAGFGPRFHSMVEWLEIGWSHIVADLILYLKRGVAAQRHRRPWASLGCAIREVPTGLEVLDVDETGLAPRVGLAPGDVVLTVGGAPVVSVRALATVMRVLRSGDKVEATWVRGRRLLTGSGAL